MISSQNYLLWDFLICSLRKSRNLKKKWKSRNSVEPRGTLVNFKKQRFRDFLTKLFTFVWLLESFITEIKEPLKKKCDNQGTSYFLRSQRNSSKSQKERFRDFLTKLFFVLYVQYGNQGTSRKKIVNRTRVPLEFFWDFLGSLISVDPLSKCFKTLQFSRHTNHLH